MGNLTAKVGIKLADKIFCTSPYSFSAKYKKTSLMPAGIDTDFFRPMSEIEKNEKQILYLGRISPIKKIEYLIEAAKILDNNGLNFKVLIVGSPGSSAVDREYELKLKDMAVGLLSKGKVEFRSAISNHKTHEVYNSSGIFVNLTPTGSFDKTILEAMSCGLPVLVSNKALEHFFTQKLVEFCVFKENDTLDLVRKISNLLVLSDKNKLGEELRDIVIINHGLSRLTKELTSHFLV